MIIEDRRNIKSKALSITSVMKNPKLSEAIFAAWGAKPGSTKGARARAILKSVHKVRQTFDGRGGAFDFYNPTNQQNTLQSSLLKPPQPQPLNQPVTPTEGRMSLERVTKEVPGGVIPKPTVFVKPGGHLLPAGYGTASFMPGVGAVSTAIQGAGLISALPQKTPTTRGELITNAIIRGAGQVQPTIESIKTGTIESLGGLIQASRPIIGKTAAYIPNAIIQAWNQPLGADGKPLPYKFPKFGLDEIKMDTPLTNWLSTKMMGKTTTPVASLTVPVIQTNPETGKLEVGDTGKTAGETDPTEKGQVDEQNYNTLSELPASELDQWYYSQSPIRQAQSHDVYEAVKNGIGASTFRIQAMTNRQTLKNLGLPDAFIDSLPSTGLLSTSLNDLNDSIKKSYQLDTQLQRLTDLQNQGLSIVADTKAYIRGKDEYLGTIDKLIDDAANIMATTDLSNPYIAQRFANYTNYLTILQGRQTQRYADFLNDATDYYNVQLNEATNLYNTSYQHAQEQYNRRASITTESYNQVGTMLEDMYKNVENRTQQMRENTRWEWEKTKANYDILASELKNYELLNKLNGNSVDYDTSIGAWDAYSQTILGVGEDKEGVVTASNYDPFVVMETASGYNRPPEIALTKFFTASGKNLYQKAQSGSFIDELNKYKDIFKSYAVAGASEEQLAVISAMTPPLRNSVADGIKSFLSSDDSKITDLREMLKSLSGTGWFKKAKASTDKQNFVNSYGNTMGDLAGIVFDVYQAILAQGKGSVKPEEVYGELLKLDNESLKRELAYEIADYIMQLQN